MSGHSKWVTTRHHREQRKIIPYLTGWERTLTAKGDIATFQRGIYQIHLIGKHDILLTSHDPSGEMRYYYGEMRFYDAARKVMELDQQIRD